MTLKSMVVVSRVDRKNWALRQPIEYQARDKMIKVPRGFVTDFASVPRILMSLFPSTGLYTLASILHDWLLTMLRTKHPVLNSNDSDGLLRRVSQEGGADFVTRWAMWTGVRWAALFDKTGYRQAGWWQWGNVWRVLAWTIVLFPGIVVAVVGVGLAMIYLLALRAIAWACRLR